eukprot:2067912-Prymnesium_polylepis.1
MRRPLPARERMAPGQLLRLVEERRPPPTERGAVHAPHRILAHVPAQLLQQPRGPSSTLQCRAVLSLRLVAWEVSHEVLRTSRCQLLVRQSEASDERTGDQM